MTTRQASHPTNPKQSAHPSSFPLHHNTNSPQIYNSFSIHPSTTAAMAENKDTTAPTTEEKPVETTTAAPVEEKKEEVKLTANVFSMFGGAKPKREEKEDDKEEEKKPAAAAGDVRRPFPARCYAIAMMLICRALLGGGGARVPRCPLRAPCPPRESRCQDPRGV